MAGSYMVTFCFVEGISKSEFLGGFKVGDQSLDWKIFVIEIVVNNEFLGPLDAFQDNWLS